jgi:hypothetical protein
LTLTRSQVSGNGFGPNGNLAQGAGAGTRIRPSLRQLPGSRSRRATSDGAVRRRLHLRTPQPSGLRGSDGRKLLLCVGAVRPRRDSDQHWEPPPGSRAGA